MLTTREGWYVPFLLVSVHPSWYAPHLPATFCGKLPRGTSVVKSSAKASFQPGGEAVGIGTPEGATTPRIAAPGLPLAALAGSADAVSTVAHARPADSSVRP